MKKVKFIAVFIAAAMILSCLVCLSACNTNTNELKVALDSEDDGRYDELFEYYTELTGVKISATYGLDVSKLIGTKDEPDIIKTSTVAVTSMRKSLMDLTSFIDKDPDINADMYIDSVMDALTIDSKIYALPTSVNTSLLYYNKALFDASASELRQAFNLSAQDSVYPRADWSYDDYSLAGRILSKHTVLPDGTVKYTQFGAEAQTTWWGEWLVYVNQMGGSFYLGGSDNKVCNINSPEAIAATQFFVDKSMGGVDAKFAPNASEATSFSFVAQNVAMILGGHLGDWYSYDLLGLDWDIQVLPTPVGNPEARGGEISADAFGISVRSRNVTNAYQFLKLWAGEQGARQMYKYGKIGALKNMRQLIASYPAEEQKSVNISALFDAIDKAVVLPNEENFSYVAQTLVMGEIYRLFLPSGNGALTDVAATLNSIKTKVDNYYAGLN